MSVHLLEVVYGGGPGRLSLLKHLIQWRHNKVTFMLNI